MLKSVTRWFSALTLRVLLYLALFAVVVLAQVAVTTGFLAIGWPAGLSLAVAGAIVLVLVLVARHVATRFAEVRAARAAPSRLTRQQHL